MAKYADLLKLTKEEKENNMIEAYVASASANIQTMEAKLIASIANAKVRMGSLTGEQTFNAQAIIEARREVKALEEDLVELKALRAELF